MARWPRGPDRYSDQRPHDVRRSTRRAWPSARWAQLGSRRRSAGDVAVATGRWAVGAPSRRWGELRRMLLGSCCLRQRRWSRSSPIREVLPALRRSLEESLPGAEVVPAAIGVHEGSAVLHDDMTWWGNSTLCHSWTGDRPDDEWREQLVATVTLDSVIADLDWSRSRPSRSS